MQPLFLSYLALQSQVSVQFSILSHHSRLHTQPNQGFFSLLWDKLSTLILPVDPILILWSDFDVSPFKPHLCFLFPLPCFLLLVLEHDPFPLLTIANSH